MGGFGSGQHLRSQNYRRTVEGCIEFKLGKLQLRKHIDDEDFDNYWSEVDFYHDDKLVFKSRAEVIKHYDGTFLYLKRKFGQTPIPLFRQPTNNGGSFPMMKCPNCKRKVLKLYLRHPGFEKWACQRCHDLAHTTSKQSTKPRKLERMIAGQMGVPVSIVMSAISSGVKKGRRKNYYIEYLHTYNQITEETKVQQTTIKLSARQIKLLDGLSGLLDLARAEIIRRAIDEYLDRREERKSRISSKKE